MKFIAESCAITVRADDAEPDDADLAFYEKSFQACEPVLHDDPWTVIDAECEEVCSCNNGYDAQMIAAALNAWETKL